MLPLGDLEARAAPLVGVPFVPKGDTPEGWDCRGCVAWCLRTFCGVDVPDYRALYEAEALSGRAGLRERGRLIAEGLAAQWRPVPPQAGAVAWLSWLGGSGHVGFMLSPRMVLHADTRCGTAIFDLDDPQADYRLKGAFAPAFAAL